MKKLLLVMLVGFGAAMLVKHGQVTLSPDNQLRVVGFAVPLPEAVQRSPILGLIAGMLPTTSTVAAATPGTPGRPAMPIVTSASNTFDANTSGGASSGNMATGADGFNAAAKALRGSR